MCGLKRRRNYRFPGFRCHTLRGCVDWNIIEARAWAIEARSHPAWVCGLKHGLIRPSTGRSQSHPAWVCGLKLSNSSLTCISRSHTLRGCVDWNISQQQLQIWDVSHPAWVCGLKLKRLLVEILSDRSHPAWVCGLKLLSHGFYLSTICHTLRGCVDWNRINGASFLTSAMSHPAWVCGLKLYLCLPILIAFGSHTLRGCVDWNRINGASFLTSAMSHPAWVCGLKLYLCLPILIAFGSHTLRGCVDWNRYSFLCLRKTSVTPCVGVWIET